MFCYQSSVILTTYSVALYSDAGYLAVNSKERNLIGLFTEDFRTSVVDLTTS